MNITSFQKFATAVLLLVVSLLLLQLFPGGTPRSSELTEVSGRLIQAVDAGNDGNYEEAVDLLENYPEQELLSDYSRYLLARALLETGNIQRARAVLDEIPSGEGNLLLGFEKKYLEAMILDRSESTDRALKVSASAREDAVTPEEKEKLLNLEFSIAYESGNYRTALEKAIEYCEATKLRFIGKKRDRLFDRISEIITETDLSSDSELDYLYRFVELLIRYGDYRRARSHLLRNMDKWEGKLRNKAYFRLAWLDGFKLDFPEEARWTFSRLVGIDQSRRKEAKTHYYLALFKDRSEDDYNLVQGLLEVNRKFPRTYYGKLAARRAFEERTRDTDISTLDNQLEQFKSSLSRSAVREATWKLFYQSFSDNRYSLALHYLDKLESFYERTPPAIVFWRYKTKEKSSETAGEYLKLTGLQNSHPLDYYSLLASEKTWARGGFSLEEKWKDTDTGLADREAEILNGDLDPTTKSTLKTAIMLKNHDLHTPALRRLERIKSRLARPDYLFLKSQWEGLAGRYMDSLKTANALLSWFFERNKRPTLTTFKSAFPTYFGKEVERIAGMFGVPKALVFAVIRQESAFESEAYSVSGAEGLMQVMPATASAIATELEMEEYETGDGFNPSINIRMGTYYVSQQVSSWGGIRLGLAAYHGGPGNLGKWKSQYNSTDTDLFIENIPADSTRNYVKAVYRNFLVYKELL